MKSTLGILWHADASLIEVANLILCCWVSVAGCLLIPVGCLCRVLIDALSRKVISGQRDLIADGSFLGKPASFVKVRWGSSGGKSLSGSPEFAEGHQDKR